MTTGDGESHTDTFSTNNANGLDPTFVGVNGPTQIFLPVGVNSQRVNGVCLVWPSNTPANRTIRGAFADQGALLPSTPNFIYIKFDPNHTPTNFWVSSDVGEAGENWTIYWT